MSSLGFVSGRPPVTRWRLLYDYTLEPVHSQGRYYMVITNDARVYLLDHTSTPYVLLTDTGNRPLELVPAKYYFPFTLESRLLPPISYRWPSLLSGVTSISISGVLPSRSLVEDHAGYTHYYDVLSDQVLYSVGPPASQYYGFVWGEGDDITLFGGDIFYAWLEESTLHIVIVGDKGPTEVTCSSSSFSADSSNPHFVALVGETYRVAVGSPYGATGQLLYAEYECLPDGTARSIGAIGYLPSCLLYGHFADASDCKIMVSDDKSYIIYTPAYGCMGLYMWPITEKYNLFLSSRLPLIVEYCGGLARVSPVMEYLAAARVVFLYSYGGKYYLDIIWLDREKAAEPLAPVRVRVYEFDPSRVGA